MGIPVREENFWMTGQDCMVVWELRKASFVILMLAKALRNPVAGVKKVLQLPVAAVFILDGNPRGTANQSPDQDRV